MLSVYEDEIKDALYPKRGSASKRSKVIDIYPPNSWDSKSIKRLRKQLRLSQTLFSKVLGVSRSTVIAWEHETNDPSLIACRFMDILKRYPDILLEASVVQIKK